MRNMEGYKLLKQLPGGAFGEVWVARDLSNEKDVVVKFLRQVSFENLQRFHREAKLYRQEQDCPFFAKLLNYNFRLPRPFIVLEYYKHGSLRSRLGSNWYDTAIWIQHAALALHSLHSKGGIHRDIKPDNLFISEDKNLGLIAVVGDLGFGRVPFPYSNSTMTNSLRGTEGYIAPELYKTNRFDPKCDIYSLGITGIELITGSRERDSINRQWISAGIKDLFLTMTSWNPDKRPEAHEVAQTIGTICQEYKSNFKTAAIVGASLVVLGLLASKSMK